MASQCMLLLPVLAIAAAVLLLPFAMAAEISVGDDNGWKPDFNYISWAEGMEFVVGDNLVFKYKPGVHNVIEVDEANFEACTAPAGSRVLTSGRDVVNLETSGTKWYLCSKEGHCKSGQKLAITVRPLITVATPPASSAPPTSGGIAWEAYQIMAAAVAVAVAAATMINIII